MLHTTGTFADLVSSILNIFNIILPVLVAVAVVAFMYGAVQYVAKRKPGSYNTILWSLIALFVLLSAWGLLRLMLNIFNIA